MAENIKPDEKETVEEVKEEVKEQETLNQSENEAVNESEESQEKEAVSGEDLAKEANEDSDDKGKKSKKSDKKEDKYKEQIAELNDKYMRQLAEFENFRNRTQKEKEAMFETGAKSIIEKILPVVDNFERGINALSDEQKEESFAKGMIGIYKQLTDELDKLDVKPIEALGKEFDPNLHNAVMQTQSEEYESGVVAQELQKGYTYRGQVVRHSMVAVTE